MAVGAAVLVSAVGVLGFMIIGAGRYGLIDAVYMTIITLSTVGFHEIIDMSGNPAGRIFTVLLVMGGMGVVAYTVPMIAAFLLEGQIRNIFARRRMQKTIAEMAGHYIVCSDTPAGWFVAQEFARTGREVVAVAPTDTAMQEALRRLGEIPSVVGDPTGDDVLEEAGVERAAGVVFSMANEKDNVLGVLTARRLAPSARIIAATEQPETETKLRTVGVDAVVSPSRIGGLRMASEMVRPKVVTFLDRMLRERGGTLRIEEVTVPQDADVTDRTLGSLKVDEVAGAMLLAVSRTGADAFEFKPAPDTPLEPGMTLVVMADVDGLERLRKRFHRATGAFLRAEPAKTE
jgi:voltage-gated potassium channel